MFSYFQPDPARLSPLIPPDLLAGPICSLDLSVENGELKNIDLLNVAELSAYIQQKMIMEGATIAIGGYGEDREVYRRSPIFGTGGEARTIHLGIDIWCPAGTAIFAPFEGEVHSFKENTGEANYGPTIILKHEWQGKLFHSLYGHLSGKSLQAMWQGKTISGGEQIATIGHEKENGHWPAHLHFQLIVDMQGQQGDYPGVCRKADWAFYRNNCPDPTGFIMGAHF